jgi:medium-chain acyl-[acyl-carrier-protein] hydrolase
MFGDAAQVVPVLLPGREARLNEPAFTDADALAELTADALAPWCREPYAVYGHSMGALLAHRTVRALLRRGLPAPEVLVVAARRAPHLPPSLPLVHDLPREGLVAKLRTMGATPETVLANDALLDVVLPTVRADFALGELAPLLPADEPLPVPIVAFGGRTDGLVDLESLAAWERHAGRSFACRLFDGGHFFHLENSAAVVRELRACMRIDGNSMEA